MPPFLLRFHRVPGNTLTMSAQYPDRPRLLIPRPEAQAKDFAAAVERAMPGAWAITIAPLMEIRFRPGPVPLRGDTVLVFTSANGVAAFCAASKARGLQAICVGPRTTAAARRAGFDARQGGADAAELVARLAAAPPGARYLHVRGAHAAHDIAGALRGAGHDADRIVLYDQAAIGLPDPVRAALAAGGFGAVTLFSPRSADLLGAGLGHDGLAEKTMLLCLSSAVATRARRFHRGPAPVAETPDAEGMLALLRRLARR